MSPVSPNTSPTETYLAPQGLDILLDLIAEKVAEEWCATNEEGEKP